MPPPADTTFTVNTTGDENDLDFPDGVFDGSSVGRCDVDGAASGRQCTLRAAIQEANATGGADTINFNIPADQCVSPNGVCTISPTTNLGFRTDAVTIDGYTQPGSQPNTLAEGDNAVLKIELDGTKPLGNVDRGVWVFGSSDNRIGGVSKAEKANKIAFNGFNGVTVEESQISFANGNRIGRNAIYANGELGIDLEGDGPTPNDNKDRDDGPNTVQNKPRLTSATTTGTKIIMQGTLRSTPNQDFTIRFFANRASEPRGYEGRTHLGLKRVNTDVNGEVSFTKALTAKVDAGQRIMATATDPGRNTSEFSVPQRVIQRQ